MLPSFIKYGKKYSDWAWENNKKATKLIDSLPSYGPKRSKPMPLKLTPTRVQRRRKGKKRSRSVYGDNVSLGSSLSSRSSMRMGTREVSEKSVTQETGSAKIRCLDRDKEGANEYARSASKKRVKYRLPYEVLQQMVAPAWAEKYTAQSRQYSIDQNSERFLEHIFLDSNFVRQRVYKSPEFMIGLNQQIQAQVDNTPVKFEGGRVRMYFINTCNVTLSFEFVQYKLKHNYHAYGAKISTQSPALCWASDQSNDNFYGDLPATNSDVALPVNTSRLAGWGLNVDPAVATAEGLVTATLADDGKCYDGLIPAGKRPNPSSPELRKGYNLIERVKIDLKPGDTFRYDFRLHPFYCQRIKGDVLLAPVSHLVQDYSRFLQIFVRGEMAVGQASGKMCPSRGQFSMSTEYDMNWRCIPRSKTNQYIEGSGNTAVLGPYTDLNAVTDTATTVEQDPADVAQFYNQS